MNHLSLSLLGGIHATHNDHPLTGFQSNKARALLAYLAVEADRPHPRQSLACMLWPDAPDKLALTYLRIALADLRKELGDRMAEVPILLVDHDNIQLNLRADVWVDVWEFEEKGVGGKGTGDRGAGFAASNLQPVIALYRGPFLEGFSIPDSASFEEWCTLKREELGQRAIRILHHLAEFYEACGEYEQALGYARQQVALEPWMEEAHRQIMRSLALNGQVSEALAQYDVCKRTLATDLGIQPSEETVRLYEILLSGRLEAIRSGELLPLPGESPYKGLHFFDEPDAHLFFGREVLTRRLLAHVRNVGANRHAVAVGANLPALSKTLNDKGGSPLQDGPPSPLSRTLNDMGGSLQDETPSQPIITIVGASGSGKSSLARAGLVPALKRQGWQVEVITPTAHPLERIGGRGRSQTCPPGAKEDGNGGILVVDQFEELFTLCRSEEERAAFLEVLLTPPNTTPNENHTWRGVSAPSPISALEMGEGRGGGWEGVFLVLRADFYSQCARYPRLREALCACQEYIGPMTAAELRQAIEQPAVRNGWQFEPGLVDLILRDVGAGADHPPEPGALPLLEHALLETWQRRSGRRMTLKGYADAGGVHGAIAKTAENVFSRLAPDQQALARRIFLRLTELGEGTQDTRRRVQISELAPSDGESSQVQDLLHTLADARLVTLGEDTAEVAHEALIREWPALRQWLSEDREGLRLHHRLAERAAGWERLGREAGELYRGARLAQALEWADAHASDLNALEREYLQTSRAQAQQEADEREAQHQRELEAAHRLAETERQRAEQQAQAAAEHAADARRLRRRALALAGALGLALVLVIVTIGLARMANTNAGWARANAQQAQAEADTRATAEAIALAQQATAEAERGRADAQRDTAQAAQTTSQAEAHARATAEVLARSQQVAAEAERIRAEENAAAAVSAQAEAQVQRLNAEQQAALAFARELASNAVRNLEQDSQFSLLLALQAVSVTQQAGIEPVPWEVQQALHDVIIQSRLIYAIPDLGGLFAWNVLFSPDGKWLAVDIDKQLPAEIGNKVLVSGITSIRDAATGQEVRWFPGYPSAFSPDGRWIAVDETLSKGIGSVKDFFTGERVITITGIISQPEGAYQAYAFSPDGNWLAWNGNGSGEPPRLWNLTAWRQAGASPGLTLNINEATRTLEGCNSIYYAITFSPDGQRLVTNCGPVHNTVKVWDVVTGQGLWESPEQPDLILTVDYSPDGSQVVSADYNSNVIVWDAATGEQLRSLKGFTGSVQKVTYSPDGRWIAASGMDGVFVWNAEDGSRLMRVSSSDESLDFSPDGTRLAVTRRGTLEMWDVTPSAGGELAVQPVPEGAYWFEVSDDRTLWMACHWDGVLEFIRADTFETISEWQVYTPTEQEPEVFFVPMLCRDNTLLATAHDQWVNDTVTGTITLWDVAARRKLMELQAPGGTRFASFSPDNTLLVSGEIESITFWDLTTRRLLRTLPVPLYHVWMLKFSPDGTHLAVNGLTDPYAGFDQRILIWDLTPGIDHLADPLEIQAFYRNVGTIDFSPDGKSLAASGLDGVKVFDVATGEQQVNITRLGASVGRAMYSPDGNYLLACWDDGVTQVYDSQTGNELVSYRSPGSFNDWETSFTADGQRIISIGSEFTFQKFAFLNFDELVAIARSRLARTWTPDECRKYLHSETCP